MIGTYPMRRDGRAMVAGGIALVAVPMVSRVLSVQPHHIVVAKSLGQNAGRGYRLVLAIALDNALERQCISVVSVRRDTFYPAPERRFGHRFVWIEPVTIYDEGLRARGELVYGAVHGQETGVKDVQTVYLLGRSHANSPSHGIAHDLRAQCVSTFGRQLFGVVKSGIVIIVRQDDGRGIDAAG